MQYVEQYLHRGQIIRTQNDYKAGQKRLESWLEDSESMLNTTLTCTINTIKEYGYSLKVSSLLVLSILSGR